ncbi:Ig-like domain-containing protein [Tunturiibacter gelidoferens]|uniref:Ig-like domain-containing protein n=1 Tax=Tunturiibacter gelidiferens TaxID=3069689 RepID=UPI0033413415
MSGPSCSLQNWAIRIGNSLEIENPLVLPMGIEMREYKNVVVINRCWLAPLFLLLTLSVGASTQATLTQLVRPVPTATVLEQPSGALFASTAVPLTIEVTSSNGLIVPNGSVTLTDNSIVVGYVTVANGIATFTQKALFTGDHQLVACYTGVANFSASCSAPLNISALLPYLLEQTNPSGSVAAPKVFVDNLKVIPTKGFSGVVRLNCQVSSYSCSLSPSSVSFSGDGSAQIVKASFSPAATPTSAGLLGLPIVGMLGVLIRRRPRRSGNIRFLLCSAALLCVVGCGPVISVPVSSATQTMLVNSTSGSYSQAVTYQIQVETDIVE